MPVCSILKYLFKHKNSEITYCTLNNFYAWDHKSTSTQLFCTLDFHIVNNETITGK